MNYQIWGEPMPAVTIRLEQGESIYTQSGGMSWMTDSIEMDTNLRGGLFKGLGRMFSGESLFMATYTASRPAQEITLASSFPGQILALQISRGQQYICQKKHAFYTGGPDSHFHFKVTEKCFCFISEAENLVTEPERSCRRTHLLLKKRNPVFGCILTG